MDIRPTLPLAPKSDPATPAELPRVKPVGQGLSPSDVPLLTADRLSVEEPSLTGKSVTEIPFAAEVEAPAKPPPIDLSDIKPRAVVPEEIEQVLEAYHNKVRQSLSQAQDDSLLDRFETSVRLMAQLKDPDLRQDQQAWDILRMRKSEVEAEYERLIQEPEIRQTFDTARESALTEIFGDKVYFRARQQAAYLLSDGFQQELNEIAPDAIQAKVEKELSALAILSPGVAESISEDLLEKTLRFQALRLVQASDEQGEAARNTLSEALSLYLKAQQSAARVGQQANNLALLANLSDEKIVQLTQAVANLAQGAQASNHQQLAQSLINRVDQLPVDLQPSANALLARMQTQNILGTVLLAGSVTSLLQQELPQDPSTWASLTAGSLSTASMSHFALRLAGFSQAADVASKINYTAQLSSRIKVPILFSAVIGINTTLDAMALARELKNEDTIGASTRAASVGAGLASMAALTVMSGPAAPITLIGATAVGLAAWGIDATYGESDRAGQVRQDLRQLGISQREAELEQKFAPPATVFSFLPSLHSPAPPSSQLAAAPVAERLSMLNRLMDQFTPAETETVIHDTLMQSSDADFVQLMRQLHTARLAAELENKHELKAIMQRTMALSDGQSLSRPLENILGRLAQEGRFEEIQAVWPEMPDRLKQGFGVESLRQISLALQDRWFPSQTERNTLVNILTDPVLEPQATALLSRREDRHFLELQAKLSVSDSARILAHLSQSETAESQALLLRLYSPAATQTHPRRNKSAALTRLGPNLQAAQLTLATLKTLKASEIQNMPPELKSRMQTLLHRVQHMPFIDHQGLAEQLRRLAAPAS